jgi:hypothetical protein
MTVELVLGIALAVVTVSALFLMARFVEGASKRQMQTVAQCDERTKAFMKFADTAIDRVMAGALPNTYASMREQSGVVEGAQYSTKEHFHDDQEIAKQLDDRRKRAEAESARMQGIRNALAGEIQQKNAQTPVMTAADFERNGATG